MENIIIVQHNVLHWGTQKFNLINTYKQINPHIILIIPHGMKLDQNIKIPGYTTYQIDTTEELNDGSALLIKSQIKQT